MVAETPVRHEWTSSQLKRAVTAAGVALWAWNVDTDAFTMDEQGFELWGLPWKPHVTFEQLSARIHPSDRDRVRAAFVATRAILGPYETDFRVLIGNEIRWVAARGEGEDQGMVDRTMFGVFLNVTGRKQAEESHELLAGEMSHRVKNLLAMASGLTAISSRSTETSEEMARELTGRLAALGRAHDLVRPLPTTQGKKALLGDLISVLLAPYDDMGAFRGRIRVSVERMGVGESAATALALVIHELATNSMKYGALSVPVGTLDVSSVADGDDIALTWSEHGGPHVREPKEGAGYGSKLVQRSVKGQLGGTIDHNWVVEGLKVVIRVKRAKLTL